MTNRSLALAVALVVVPCLSLAPRRGEAAGETAGVAAHGVRILDPTVSSTGLIANFPFVGDYRDASGTVADAVPSGASLTADRFGRPSSAVDLPVGASVAFHRGGTIGTQATFAAWLYLRQGAATWRPLFTTTPTTGFLGVLYGADSGQLRVYNGPSIIRTVTHALPAERWFHYALVFDGTNCTTYVDGAAVDAFAYGGGLAGGADFFLGLLTTDARYSWDGKMDDVRVYTRGLTAAEVAQLASEELCPAQRSLPRYTPGQKARVLVAVSLPGGTATWSAEETPPAGWPVSEVDNGGSFDAASGKVRWGPFSDPAPRTLAYTVTPPLDASGKKTVSGSVTYGGSTVATCGDTDLSLAQVHPADTNEDLVLSEAEALAYVTAWQKGAPWPSPPSPIPATWMTNAGLIYQRGGAYVFASGKTPPFAPASGGGAGTAGSATGTFDPCSYAAGGTVRVALSATPPAGAKAWVVEDQLPPGWTASAIDGSGTWDAAARKVRWGPFTDETPRTLGYTATAGGSDSGPKTFSGTISTDGLAAAVGGSRAIDSTGCGGEGTTYWVAAVVHAPGLKESRWRTDVTILNTGAAAANVELKLYTGSGVKSSTQTVAGATQVVLSDLWATLATGDGAGPLEVASDQPLLVAARTYNSSDTGTYGSPYQALTPSQGLKATDAAYLVGLREDGSFRTNIGLANAGTDQAVVTVTLFDGSGVVVTQLQETIPPASYIQEVQPFYTTGGTVVVNGYARVNVVSGSGVMAFASVIDNQTNDPTSVYPQR